MLDCFSCGARLFKLTETMDCCSSCGRIDSYRRYNEYDLPKEIGIHNEGEQDVKE
jgi:hypothetical protein